MLWKGISVVERLIAMKNGHQQCARRVSKFHTVYKQLEMGTRKCSSVSGSLSSVVATFECNICLEVDASGGNVELDSRFGVGFECAKKFCYFIDILDGKGKKSDRHQCRGRQANPCFCKESCLKTTVICHICVRSQ